MRFRSCPEVSFVDARVSTCLACSETRFIQTKTVTYFLRVVSVHAVKDRGAKTNSRLFETLDVVVIQVRPSPFPPCHNSMCGFAEPLNCTMYRGNVSLRQMSWRFACLSLKRNIMISVLPICFETNRPCTCKQRQDPIGPSGMARVTTDGWGMQAVPVSPDSFENRQDLPASWAGCTGAELEAASGVDGAIFCHSSRFYASASSREGILALAQRALPA